MDISARIDELIVKGGRVLVDAKFPASLYFDIPDSKNIAWLQVVKSYKGEGLFRLNVSVSREGSASMQPPTILSSQRATPPHNMSRFLVSFA